MLISHRGRRKTNQGEFFARHERPLLGRVALAAARAGERAARAAAAQEDAHRHVAVDAQRHGGRKGAGGRSPQPGDGRAPLVAAGARVGERGQPAAARRAVALDAAVVVHDGLSFAEHVLAARPRVAEERSLVALVSSMADYRSEGEYDQTELARAGQHSNSTVLLLERRSDTPRVGELHRKADDRVVSKKIEFKGMGERDQLQLEREVSCLKRCHHAHIVTYHGAFAAEGTLHIITEYCGGGSLADRIKTHQADGAPFASARVATWLRQLVGALSHVHALGLLHRDVKSSNVFLTAAGTRADGGSQTARGEPASSPRHVRRPPLRPSPYRHDQARRLWAGRQAGWGRPLLRR